MRASEAEREETVEDLRVFLAVNALLVAVWALTGAGYFLARVAVHGLGVCGRGAPPVRFG